MIVKVNQEKTNHYMFILKLFIYIYIKKRIYRGRLKEFL